jgi:hypothetical protein
VKDTDRDRRPAFTVPCIYLRSKHINIDVSWAFSLSVLAALIRMLSQERMTVIEEFLIQTNFYFNVQSNVVKNNIVLTNENIHCALWVDFS